MTQTGTQGVNKDTTGGANTSPVSVFTSLVVIKAALGILCNVLVTTAIATAAIIFYDNASTGSGTIIGYIPSGTAAGTVYSLQMPANLGITIGTSSGTGALTVSYF